MTEARLRALTSLPLFLAAFAFLLSVHAAETSSKELGTNESDRAVSDPWVVYEGSGGPGPKAYSQHCNSPFSVTT
jgi:hypothetical protein